MISQNLRMIAFPREHGAYGFTIEPLLLGLLAAFTMPGFCLAIGTLLLFFAHQPLKVLYTDNKNMQKTALVLLGIYGLIASTLIYFFLKQASLATATPFYVAITLMIFYLIMDLLHFSRHIVIEIVAPAAIGLIAVSIVLNAGWNLTNALGLWILLAARFIPTPFYIRSRLQLERNLPADLSAAIVLSVSVILLVLLLTLWDITPLLGLLGVLILGFRAWTGLSPWRKKSTVRAIGMREFFYGQVLVLLSAIGYFFSI